METDLKACLGAYLDLVNWDRKTILNIGDGIPWAGPEANEQKISRVLCLCTMAPCDQVP